MSSKIPWMDNSQKGTPLEADLTNDGVFTSEHLSPDQCQVMLQSLTGTSIESIGKCVIKLNRDERTELAKLSIMSAIGGRKAVDNLPRTMLMRVLAGSCFTRRDNKFQEDWNITCLNLVGHYLIASGFSRAVSFKFNEKYQSPNVWQIPKPDKEDDKSDKYLKWKFARNHPYKIEELRQISFMFSPKFDLTKTIHVIENGEYKVYSKK